MTIRSLLDAAARGEREPTLSYELFPPRTTAAEDTLLLTMGMLAATKPGLYVDHLRRLRLHSIDVARRGP